MPQASLGAELLASTVDTYLAHGSIAGAATALGLPRGTFENRLRRAVGAGLITEEQIRAARARRVAAPDEAPGTAGPGVPPVLSATPEDSVVVEGDRCEIRKGRLTTRVRTLADLVRVCEIDTAAWDIDRWECKAYQQASVPRAVGKSQQWRRPSATPVITQLYSVSVRLKRKGPLVLTMERLRDELVADIRAEVKRGKAPAVIRHRFVDGGYLFEFAPFDLHAGKYTWADETVTDYDLATAANLFEASLDFLLERAVRVAGGSLEQAVVIVGNDVSHTDQKKGQTTAGTPMDVDTRYIKVFRRICEIHRRAFLKIREVCPVVGKVVPGNHDELTSFHVGEILAARFESTPHVTIDNGPKLRKYHEFGVNLLGFTHGDAQKVDELPLTMAREEPEAWARCTEREWHIGHLHIKEQKEWRPVQTIHSDKGIRVRRLPSLSAHDFWHTRHGYMDRRACESFVFHKAAGYTDSASFNVDHLTGRAMPA